MVLTCNFVRAAFFMFIAALLYSCGGTEVGLDPAADETLGSALSELEQLPPPEGMSPERFDNLKAAVASALQGSGQTRFAAAAPKAGAGAVDDLRVAVQNGNYLAFTWTYRNKGDYDQNRQVNISDLSVLGPALGKTSASNDWLSKARAADGNADGIVTINDLTPIGANYFATVQGYKLQSTATPAVDASWTTIESVDFSQSAVPATSALRVFSYTLFGGVPQTWYRVVPFDGASLGAPSNAVQFALLAPEVTAVTPAGGEAGTAVTFDADLSSTWRWNFGGGAVPDTSTLPSPAVQLGAAGTYQASVTVENAAGTDIHDFTIVVSSPAPPVIDDVQPQGGTSGEAVTFSASVSGGAVGTYAWDFGGGASPNQSSGITPLVTLGPPGTYNASLTVSNAGGSTTYDFELKVSDAVNTLPTASFTATPDTGLPGTPVTLDASGSSDFDGSIVRYEWDLDGDDVFETDGGASPTQQTVLPTPAGAVVVSLQVTDDRDASSITSLTLTSVDEDPVNPFKLTVDSAGNVGLDSSMALVDRRPAIAYYDDTNDDLKYAYSTTMDGSSGWVTVTVDAAGLVGHGPSLAVINGRPAIAYWDETNDNVKYAHSSTADGSGGWSTLTVDAGDKVGWHTSLAQINGKPAIAYLDHGSWQLKYAYSDAADGSSDWSTITVPTPGYELGGFMSLAQVDGKPATTLWDQTNWELKYAYSTAADGSSGWNVVTIDDTADVGWFPSLEVVNGKPAVSYWDTSNGDLKYAYSLNANGTAGWVPVTVDSEGFVGYYTSLAVIAGKPAISYWDSANETLKYARSATLDGSADWTAQIVDTQVGLYTSLIQLANGQAAISYENDPNHDLRYAVLAP
jgi:PKD repeat protein